MEMILNTNMQNEIADNDRLLRLLDKGIDDMEAGRELPFDEAFEKITELRNIRRNAGK